MYEAGDVRIEDVPDPSIVEPTDAILRVTRAGICGGDLWPYASLEPTETVMPFAFSDGTCAFCHEGLHTACVHGGFFDGYGTSAAHAEAVRVPYADGTLFPLPVGEDDALTPSLLTLSDVTGTGHHAAVVSEVGPGKSVAIVGDGAVGLCGVIAARRLGAEQIIILGRHEDRLALAREFGATDVVPERGDEAVERVKELTGGFGAHSVLSLPAFFGNVTIGGGPAPARAYIEELLPEILEGRIEPGRVFDRTVDLDGVPDGYGAMADREALKVMIKP
jgi:threonine dehydrogenase-like Zn-dependent dehydrogenase